MFAQVACWKCGKPFQVPQAQLGQPVACPWCRETGTPLPVVGVVPEALPDDAPPHVRAVAKRVDAKSPASGSKRPWLAPVVVILLSLLVLVVAYLGARYYRGSVPGFVWQRFDAPDGTCRIDLPGGTAEAELPANPKSPITRAGKRFTASSTFTRLGGFVGWYDLDPALIALTRSEDVFGPERDRRKAETGWTVEAESSAAKFGSYDPHAKSEKEKNRYFDTLEVRYVGGSTKYVERYVYVTAGPKPRLYVLGVGGGGFDPDGDAAKRVLSSFWFDETK